MVPFAGYSMPVQYPAGLMAEHHHTRNAAGLFDVSHMGQLRLEGADAAAAFETLVPVDVVGLGAGKQRYGLLLTDEGTIIDDLMMVNRGDDLFVIVNGACKEATSPTSRPASAAAAGRPDARTRPARTAGPAGRHALQRCCPGVEKLVFMTGDRFAWQGGDCTSRAAATPARTASRSRSTPAQAEALARANCSPSRRSSPSAWARATRCGWKPACACTATTSTPPPRRSKAPSPGRSRRCAAPAARAPAASRAPTRCWASSMARARARKRVGLVALERVPVREHTPAGQAPATPSAKSPAACSAPPSTSRRHGLRRRAHAAVGTRLNAIVRGKAVPMEVSAMPFVPQRYHRG
jgi:aminomethyltransferase